MLEKNKETLNQRERRIFDSFVTGRICKVTLQDEGVGSNPSQCKGNEIPGEWPSSLRVRVSEVAGRNRRVCSLKSLSFLSTILTIRPIQTIFLRRQRYRDC